MFSKNIDCSDVLEDKIFYLYSNKSREVVVGANIIVPEGFSAVFVCKDKVCDVILNGKFAINGANLPKTFSTMKLGKANKKGKYKKRFVADIYFITKKKQQNLDFCSYDKYFNKDPKFGKVAAYSQGQYDLEITDPDKLLKYMLSERAYIKEDLFVDLLSGLVGNYINRKLELCFDDFYYILTSPVQVNEKLNTIIDMECYFEDYGFKISNIKFQSLNVSSKLKGRVMEELKTVRRTLPQMRQINVELPVLKEVTIDMDEDKTDANNEATKCPKCGHTLSTSSVFCEKCGTKVNNLN